MKFSVVIPLFNKEHFIEKTIASVLEQTYPHFELWVIDDGSTDRSLEILKRFEDTRLKIISTKNNGVSAARNLGVAQAMTSYVALLDGDDWWAPTYLEEIKSAIEAFPNNKIFATGRTHVFAEKQVEYKNSYLPKKGNTGRIDHFRIISKYLPAINSSSITIKKDYFLEKGRFNEGMHHFEDHECWLRLALEQPIVFVNKPLSFYNKTVQESMSQSVVRSSDLKHYFKTMILIKDQLSGKQRRDFKKFYQRFAKWSYLKYASTYSETEQRMLQEFLQELLSLFEVKVLDQLQKVGIANLYQRAKKMKDGGS